MTEETRCHPATGAALATLLIETTVAGQAGGTRAASPIRAALKIHPLSGGGDAFARAEVALTCAIRQTR
jgi:hypothetical protein